jgi:hypothetical protein
VGGGQEFAGFLRGERFAGVEWCGCFDADDAGDVAEDEFFAAGVFERGAQGGVDVLDESGVLAVGRATSKVPW